MVGAATTSARAVIPPADVATRTATLFLSIHLLSIWTSPGVHGTVPTPRHRSMRGKPVAACTSRAGSSVHPLDVDANGRRCVAGRRPRGRARSPPSPSLRRVHLQDSPCNLAARHRRAVLDRDSCPCLYSMLAWGRWGSNPRPRDYESCPSVALTCFDTPQRASDLGLCLASAAVALRRC